MLQRTVFYLRHTLPYQQLVSLTENEFSKRLVENAAAHPAAGNLAEGLFGHQRRLYKRLAQYTLSDSPEVFAAVARRPYAELVEVSGRLAEQLSRRLSRPLLAHEVLIDAPPVKLEVQFQIDIRQNIKHHALAASSTARFQKLSNVSPVVRALATDQFDNFVKRIRIFIAPARAAELLLAPDEVTQALLSVADDLV